MSEHVLDLADTRRVRCHRRQWLDNPNGYGRHRLLVVGNEQLVVDHCQRPGGSGNATLTYLVAPYTGKPKKRTGTITVAGQTLTVQQSR